MSIFTEIRAALETQVVTVAGFPSVSNRAWEAVKFTPTTGTAWARMSLVPTAIDPAARGSNPQRLHEGLFLVDLFMPSSANDGPGDGDILADAVLDKFKVDTPITFGSTTVRFRTATRGQGITNSPWYQVPVSIFWYTYRI